MQIKLKKLIRNEIKNHYEPITAQEYWDIIKKKIKSHEN